MVLIWGSLLRPVDGLVTASGNVVLRNLTHSLPCVVYYIKGPPCSRDAWDKDRGKGSRFIYIRLDDDD